jgi:putative SOS response-associated peptidase YedK
MCARITLKTPWAEIIRQFGLLKEFDFPVRYNIAPTQTIVALRADESGQDRWALLRWGLIPSWSKEPSRGAPLINARSETVHEKPAFRAAFRKRRCLVLADGYYEWRAEGKQKQPYYIRRTDERPFALAGLWESWIDQHAATAEPLETCTVLTTEANALTADIHDRMPVILPEEACPAWLHTPADEADSLRNLLRPAPADLLQVSPVSTRVNSVKHDDPECLKPAQRMLF